MIDHVLGSLYNYPGFWAMHGITLAGVLWILLWSPRTVGGGRNAWEEFVERELAELKRRVKTLMDATPTQKATSAPQKTNARQVQWDQKQHTLPRTSAQPTPQAAFQQGTDRAGEDRNPIEQGFAYAAPAGRNVESQYEGGRMPPRAQPMIYYASVPEADGTFKESQLSREAQYDSLYRLEVTPDGKTASLGLHRNPDSFRAAVESPRRYLDPACSYKESSFSSAMTPVESRSGFAVLEDARWRIQQKIEVEFQ